MPISAEKKAAAERRCNCTCRHAFEVEFLNFCVIETAQPIQPIPRHWYYVMTEPRNIADRMRELRDLGKRQDDHPLHETITLPLHEARFKARQLLDERAAACSRLVKPAARRQSRPAIENA
jgi:hypothetical protein